MVRSQRFSYRVIMLLLVATFIAGCNAGSPAKLQSSTTQGTSPASTSLPTWQHATMSHLSDDIDRYIATMSLDERIGQLMVVQFITDGYIGDSITMMQKYQPGALVLYRWVMNDANRVLDMTSRSQHDSKIPLMIEADIEGGGIDSLLRIYTDWRPTALEIAQSGKTQFAYDQGQKAAHDLKSVGMNTNLAPDVDVETAYGPDQGARVFGTTPDPVIKYAGPYLDGLQQNGVLGTLKHFPGLGGATIDAHKGLPIIHRTKDQIEQVDLAPYRALINSADPPDMIMSTDLLMPAIDPKLPAELSPTFITGILRNAMHYDGVIMTDALYMQGISDIYPMDQAGVLALIAGCDMLIGAQSSATTAAMFAAIKAAINDGRLTEARINQSVHRILLAKALRLGWTPPTN